MNNKKLLNNKDITKLMALLVDYKGLTPYLCGGAIIDILNGKIPKDFDIVTYDRKSLVTYLVYLGAKYSYESSTAITLIVKDIGVVQILKGNTQDFDYTINQTRLNLKTGVLSDLDIISFDNYILIPNERAFSDKDFARKCLGREKKMNSKGYFLPKQTKDSLRRIAKLGWLNRLIMKFKKTEYGS